NNLVIDRYTTVEVDDVFGGGKARWEIKATPLSDVVLCHDEIRFGFASFVRAVATLLISMILTGCLRRCHGAHRSNTFLLFLVFVEEVLVTITQITILRHDLRRATFPSDVFFAGASGWLWGIREFGGLL